MNRKNVRGRRWAKLRDAFIHQNPLCLHCKASGRVEAAREVDHILALKDGGSMFNPFNLQSLCKRCHVEKSARDIVRRKDRARKEFWKE